MGLIDASKPRSFKPRRGLLADTQDSPAPVADTLLPGGGDGRDLGGRTTGGTRDFASVGDFINDPEVRNDFSNLAGMGSIGLFGGAIRDMLGLGEQQGPSDAMAGLGGIEGAGSVGESPGLYEKGGKVGRKGLLDGDPPGPDNVIIGAKTGERVLNQAQYDKLSPEAKKEVDALMKKAKR